MILVSLASACGMPSESDSCFESFMQLALLNPGVEGFNDARVRDSASRCIAEWTSTPPFIPHRYSLLYSAIAKLVSSHDGSTMREAINLFFPSLLNILEKIDDSEQCEHLQQWSISFYKNAIEEHQCCSLFMQQLLWQREAFVLNPQFSLDIVFDAMGSESPLLRKYGLSLLNTMLKHIFSVPSHFAPLHSLSPEQRSAWQAETEKHWETYISVYQTLDEYATHLVRSVWSKVDTLTAYSAAVASIDFLQIDHHWVELLYRRGLTQGNPHIRSLLFSFILSPASQMLKHASDSVAFVVNTVLPLVNDASLFKGALYGLGFPFLSFLLHFVTRLTDAERDDFCRAVFRVLRQSITNPLAFQFILGLFDPAMVPQPPRDLADSVNSSAAGAESMTREMIEEVMHFSLPWSPRLDDELCNTLIELSDKISTQISQASLQKKAQRTLLSITKQGRIDRENAPCVLRTLSALRKVNDDHALDADLLRFMEPVKEDVDALLLDQWRLCKGKGPLAGLALLAQLDQHWNGRINDEVYRAIEACYDSLVLGDTSALHLLVSLCDIEGLFSSFSPEPVLSLLRHAWKDQLSTDTVLELMRVADAVSHAALVEEMNSLVFEEVESTMETRPQQVLRWLAGCSACGIRYSKSLSLLLHAVQKSQRMRYVTHRIEQDPTVSSAEKAELIRCAWRVVLFSLQHADTLSELSEVVQMLTRECHTADNSLMSILLPLIVCVQSTLVHTYPFLSLFTVAARRTRSPR